eukprot:c20514_g1_i1 orf=322-975(+)
MRCQNLSSAPSLHKMSVPTQCPRNLFSLKSPFILFPHCFFLLWGKVILDIESFSNLLRSLVLDHICHCLAAQIQKALYVQIVRCQEEIVQHILIHVHKLSIEEFHIVLRGRPPPIIPGRPGSGVKLTILNHLSQNLATHIRKRNGNIGASILDHIFDSLRLNGHNLLHLEDLAITASQLDPYVRSGHYDSVTQEEERKAEWRGDNFGIRVELERPAR